MIRRVSSEAFATAGIDTAGVDLQAHPYVCLLCGRGVLKVTKLPAGVPELWDMVGHFFLRDGALVCSGVLPHACPDAGPGAD